MSGSVVSSEKAPGFIKNPLFWLLIITFILISELYYTDSLVYPRSMVDLFYQISTAWRYFDRVAFLIPLIMSGFTFNWRGTIIFGIIVLASMLGKVLLQVPLLSYDIFASIAIFISGEVIAIATVSFRKQKVHRDQLVAVNKVARAISHSLELEQVLSSGIDSVLSVMNIDAAMIFLIDEVNKDMVMASHKGLSEEFVDSVRRFPMAGSLNGTVAIKGEPEFVWDAFAERRIIPDAKIEFENLRSLYIVPLRSKGRVMGTLCVATHNKYQLSDGEMETATIIGNQIGVAVENARIFEHEKQVADKLKLSEEKYKQLFENAHDAIWSDDISGNIIGANNACVQQSGYSRKELFSMKSADLLSKESRDTARTIRRILLAEKTPGLISEVKLIRKDGTELTLQLASSLLYSNGLPSAFQHIARDITKERQLQENLRFYIEQVTKAQEEERKRISRELHDETIQSLVALGREIDEVTSIHGDKSSDKLMNLRESINTIMNEVRSISQNLRPPALDRLGLVPALEWLANNVQQHSGIPVIFLVSGRERRFTDEVEITLFRITQEALNNVWLHSKATEAGVTITFDDHALGIVIKDNGIGIGSDLLGGDLTRSGKLGLAGIRERVHLLSGSISIESKPGKGTRIEIEVSL
jgi:PAS domain S-box-containing protein